MIMLVDCSQFGEKNDVEKICHQTMIIISIFTWNLNVPWRKTQDIWLFLLIFLNLAVAWFFVLLQCRSWTNWRFYRYWCHAGEHREKESCRCVQLCKTLACQPHLNGPNGGQYRRFCYLVTLCWNHDRLIVVIKQCKCTKLFVAFYVRRG